MGATGKALSTRRFNRHAIFIPRKLLIVVAILLLIVLAGVLVVYKWTRSDVARGTAALVDAFSKRRVIEPRLSGGFKGGPFERSLSDASNIDASKLDEAVGLITEAVSNGLPLSDLAYSRLLLSQNSKIPEALRHLRLALTVAPDSAEAHNDLGVCFIQQEKLEDAIDEFEIALGKRTDMPEALFNRGLCYQRLFLREAAASDYKRLAEIDRDKTWLGEITQRQQENGGPLAPRKRQDEILSSFEASVNEGNKDEIKRIADQHFEVLRKYATGDLTVSYLRASLEGGEKADQLLTRMEAIGEQFERSRGDSAIGDLVKYLRSLSREQREAELRLLVDYSDSERLIAQKKSVEAGVAFERLGREFGGLGNTFMQCSSDMYRAGCLYSTGSFKSSVDILRNAISMIDAKKWPYLKAQLTLQLGSGCSRLGEDSLAIKYYDFAMSSMSNAPLLQAKTLQYKGNTHWRLGDLENAAVCLRESSRLYFGSVPSPSELAYNSLQIADIYRTRGNHPLALLYARQALDFLSQTKDNNQAAQLSAFIALEHGQLGQFDRAEKELTRATDFLQQIEPGQRAYTEPLVLTRAGELAALEGDASRGEQYYTQAKEIAEKAEDSTILVIRALRGRAAAYVQAKEFEKARGDLDQAIKLVESYRAGIAERQNRSSFLDASQSVFDQMLLLNVGVFERPEEAFNYSEESRARNLLDEFAGGGPKRDGESPSANPKSHASPAKPALPLKLDAIQSALTDDLRLLVYSVTKEGTYLFLVTRNGFEVHRSPATTEILDRLVHDYVTGVKTRMAYDELSALSGQLYRYLIEPIEAKLGDGRTLCIVPDKALHFLPFAALTDPSGRYLIQSHSLMYEPSATSLVRSIEEAGSKTSVKERSILAVGNPKINFDQLTRLSDLPDAEREATASASFYKQKTVLIGNKATEREVRADLKGCDVAHLAVHCVVEEKSQWFAALALSSEAGARDKPLVLGNQISDTDGLLYLNELYGMSLPRTRLVVLSACESGLGQYYRGEGIVSLVRPFLAARVPTVIASLWSVDSRATADLMVEFHRQRESNGLKAGDALRSAQITMVASENYSHPYYWAAFISVGVND